MSRAQLWDTPDGESLALDIRQRHTDGCDNEDTCRKAPLELAHIGTVALSLARVHKESPGPCGSPKAMVVGQARESLPVEGKASAQFALALEHEASKGAEQRAVERLAREEDEKTAAEERAKEKRLQADEAKKNERREKKEAERATRAAARAERSRYLLEQRVRLAQELRIECSKKLEQQTDLDSPEWGAASKVLFEAKEELRQVCPQANPHHNVI